MCGMWTVTAAGLAWHGTTGMRLCGAPVPGGARSQRAQAAWAVLQYCILAAASRESVVPNDGREYVRVGQRGAKSLVRCRARSLHHLTKVQFGSKRNAVGAVTFALRRKAMLHGIVAQQMKGIQCSVVGGRQGLRVYGGQHVFPILPLATQNRTNIKQAWAQCRSARRRHPEGRQAATREEKKAYAP